jgi:biotin synthase-related radical SAM superfamily protein
MRGKWVNERPKITVDIYSKMQFMEWRLEVNGSECKLCFVKNKDKGFLVHVMKVYRGVEVKLHSFLTSELEREREREREREMNG